MTSKAKRKAKISPGDQALTINSALYHLRMVRMQLRLCGSKKAADYVQRAIKSAEGARNHALRMAE